MGKQLSLLMPHHRGLSSTKLLAIVLATSMYLGLQPLHAEDLPEILLTPGQAMPDQLNDPRVWQEWIVEKIAGRRGTLPPEFEGVAETFQRVGTELGIFWPGALVQSALETGFYQYGGDVPAKGHGFNVGGVGITKEQGRRVIQDFESLENGVRAFLQHLKVYAGEDISSPLAEKTKRDKAFILSRVRPRIRGGRPIRFIDLGSYVVVPARGRETKEFIAMAENYAGSVAEFRRLWQEYQRSGIGGAALGYAGDPLYAWKWAGLWRDAVGFVEQRIAAHPKRPDPGIQPMDCSDLSGAWVQQSSKGTSAWILTRVGGNAYAYDAKEQGLGNATGKARYVGNRLRIEWKTGSLSGVYEWEIRPDCSGGRGRLFFTTGGRRSADETSTVARRSTSGTPAKKHPWEGMCLPQILEAGYRPIFDVLTAMWPTVHVFADPETNRYVGVTGCTWPPWDLQAFQRDFREMETKLHKLSENKKYSRSVVYKHRQRNEWVTLGYPRPD